MAVSVATIATFGTGASGTTLTLSAASATAGRIWHAYISCRAADNINSVPTDWTLIRNTVTGTSASQAELNTYKWTGVGTPTGDQIWGFDATAYRNGVMVEFTGADSATPEADAGTVSSPDVAPDITTVTANAMAVCIVAKNSGGSGTSAAATEPTDYTEILDQVASRVGLHVSYKIFASAGATGTQAFTYVEAHVVQHLAMKPAAAGVGSSFWWNSFGKPQGQVA